MAVDFSLNFESKLAQDFFGSIQKNIKDTLAGERKYALGVGAFVYKDVIDHFEKESGPKGKWFNWTDVYAEHMAKIGKGGNKKLQDSGRLRNNMKPGSYKKLSGGAFEWFNDAKTNGGFPYAWHHDEGRSSPKGPRNFMWASANLMDNVARITLAFALQGKL